MKTNNRRSMMALWLGAALLVGVAAGATISESRADATIWRERDAAGRKPYIDPAYNEQFVQLADDAIPAVVSVATTETLKPFRGFRNQPNGEPMEDFFDFFFGPQNRRPFQRQGLGSGFVINPEGYVFTNNHVVENADKIVVTLSDNTEYEAKIVGADAATDMALLKIEPGRPLPYLPLGDSDALRIGEIVVAIGNPLGLSHTVTRGIVSQKGRKDINPSGRGIVSNFIQTDASINPGNSGGPLLNIYGEVIGINTAVARAQGIGFAIPINMAKTLLPQLVKGKIERSWLGIQVQQVTSELAGSLGLDRARGALVADVVANGPAAKAGIQAEDVILRFDGKDIDNYQDLIWLASTAGAGRKIAVEVWRDRRKLNVTVAMAARPEDEDDSAPAAGSSATSDAVSAAGVTVRNASPAELKRSGIEDGKGVVVLELDPKTSAGRSGLREGDVVRKVNRVPITDARSFERAMGEVRAGSFVRLLVSRGQAALFIAFQK